MAHNTSNTFYFSSGEIKFSKIRDEFGFPGGTIKASELVRDTDVQNTNPKIPDATENSNILSSVSSGSNWKASHFRSSIKEYELFQYDTDTDVILSSLSWNSNLSKNVKKKYKVIGKIGGTSSGGSALTVNGTIYNLTVEVSGYVLGYGGLAGIKGSSSTTSTVPTNVSAYIRVINHSKESPNIKLITEGEGDATVRVYAGMRDYSNGDKRPWRKVKFGSNSGVQEADVDPGPSGSSSNRERDFYFDLPVTGRQEYSIEVTNLQKDISYFKNYGTNTSTLPNGSNVNGFGMRDADNDICRGQVKVESVTQGSRTITIGAGSGTDGGNAINVNSNGSRVKIVEVGSNLIRGGGGGGGAGKDGATGTGGFCNSYGTAVNSRTSTTRCRAIDNNMDLNRAQIICNGLGYANAQRTNSSDCCEREPDREVCVRYNKKGVCKQTEFRRGKCIKETTYVKCWNNYSTPGGAPGSGGNGGRGRGYNWNQLDGSTDKPITAPAIGEGGGPTEGGKGGGCGAQNGTDGTRGGDGGKWNTAGTKGDTGNGGAAGQRIVGTNWTS